MHGLVDQGHVGVEHLVTYRRGLRALRLDLPARRAEGIQVVGERGPEFPAVAGGSDGIDRRIQEAAVDVRPADLPGGIELRQLRAGDGLQLVLGGEQPVARRVEVRVVGERGAYELIERLGLEQLVPVIGNAPP